jgi:hypothetical protein
LSIPIDVYTDEAVVRGVVTKPGPIRDRLEVDHGLVLDRAAARALDGGLVTIGRPVELTAEEIDVAAPTGDGTVLAFRSTWHPLRLDVGPYIVEGELPTQPGFDPGRALTRPAGDFVLLRNVRIGLRGRPDVGEAAHAMALVHRYAVETVESEIGLGFFFPGARVAVAAGSP